MSAICGVVDFSGTLPKEEIEHMVQAMNIPGHDRVSYVKCEGASFAFLNSINTPEDEFEAQPYKLDDERLFSCSARLYNRADLLAVIGVPKGKWDTIADGTLVRMAFERWGRNCLQHLIGQFSFAVWNPINRELLLACDHMGERSLYFTKRSTRFAFASLPVALFALPYCPRELDDQAFFNFLAHHYEDSHRTLFVGVDRLSSGTALKVNRDSEQRIEHWDLENLPRSRFNHPMEMFERFEQLMEEVTSARLRSTGQIGILLSGGLDSSLVAGFSAQQLCAQERPLYSYTLRPLSKYTEPLTAGRIADEKPYVDALAKLHPNLKPLFSDAGLPHFLEILDQVFEVHHCPPVMPSQHAWIHAGVQRLMEQGVGVVLQGQRGNHTVSWPGKSATCEMLLSGQWSRLAKHLYSNQKRTGMPLSQVMREFVKNVCRLFGNSILDVLNKPNHDGYHPFLNPSWRNEIDFKRRFRSEFRQKVGRQGPDGRAFRTRVLRYSGYRQRQDTYHNLAASLGSECSDVTADRRLVEFSLSLADTCFHYNGWDRAPARFSCGNRVPDLVRWRTTRGLQPIDALALSLRNANLVEGMLEELHSRPGIAQRLDLNAMQSFWQEMQTPHPDRKVERNPSFLIKINEFHSALAAGAFLKWLGIT